MSYANGRLPDSALAEIPGGRLANDGAAASWNAGPAKAGLRPLGPNSSYRTYEKQVEFYNLYGAGRAAYPGTSNHGWGHAVDLADGGRWMREWIIEHGHQFGWYWGEVTSEPWHCTFNPEWWTGKPEFKTLRYGVKNNPSRVRRLQKLLRHAGGVLPKRKPHRYWPRGLPYTGRFGRITERRVKRFQRDHDLKPDGVVGEKTWSTLRRIGRKDAG